MSTHEEPVVVDPAQVVDEESGLSAADIIRMGTYLAERLLFLMKRGGVRPGACGVAIVPVAELERLYMMELLAAEQTSDIQTLLESISNPRRLGMTLINSLIKDCTRHPEETISAGRLDAVFRIPRSTLQRWETWKRKPALPHKEVGNRDEHVYRKGDLLPFLSEHLTRTSNRQRRPRRRC